MKTKFFIAGIFLAAVLADAQTIIPGPRVALPSNSPIVLTASATNDFTSELQRGLFEEEGNHDLDAAISAYQSLAAQFDKSRPVAATAIFRLGECYRKLGRTNEAVAQYDRVVREFSDQQTLATLSRQNLAGLGAEPVKDVELANELIGTWILVGAPEQVGEVPAKGARFKFCTGSHWCDSQADPKTGVVKFHHGGTYTLKGNEYIQNVKYANESSEFLIGNSFKFIVKIEGDTLHLTGIGNPWNEVWKRAK